MALCPATLSAQAQTLDPSFSGSAGGEVETIVPQLDAKLLVVGRFLPVLDGHAWWGVGRLQADGALDTSFVPINPPPASGIFLQEDGKALAVGFSYLEQPGSDLVRFNADGTSQFYRVARLP